MQRRWHQLKARIKNFVKWFQEWFRKAKHGQSFDTVSEVESSDNVLIDQMSSSPKNSQNINNNIIKTQQSHELVKCETNQTQIFLQADKSSLLQISTILDENKALEELITVQNKKINDLQQEKSNQDKKISDLQQENMKLKAKYQAKCQAGDIKKERLNEYHEKHKMTRKGLQQAAEDLLKDKELFVPHARVTSKSNKLGKPKGGRGGGRKRPIHIHQTIELYPQQCPHCHTSLQNARENKGYTHYLTDLEINQPDPRDYQQIRLKNIAINKFGRMCPTCQRWIYNDTDVLKGHRFGLNFILYVFQMRIKLRLPYKLIIADLQSMFGPNFMVSETSIVNWFNLMEPYIRPIFDQLQELVLSQDFNHIDETGCPINGENWWVWVICNTQLTCYLLDKSRGNQAVADLLKNYQGVLVCDCWSAYNKLDHIEQQKCLAHIVTDLNVITVKTQKENEKIEEKLHAATSSASTNSTSLEIIPTNPESSPSPPKKRRGRPPKNPTVSLSPALRQTLLDKQKSNQEVLEKTLRLKEFLSNSWSDEKPLGWKTSKDKQWSKDTAEHELSLLLSDLEATAVKNDMLRKIIKRCHKFGSQLFTYLNYTGMPPDNNQAERDVRPFAVQRKISGTFKNPAVLSTTLMLKSLHDTAVKNKKDLMPWLKTVFLSLTFNQPGLLKEFLFTG